MEVDDVSVSEDPAVHCGGSRSPSHGRSQASLTERKEESCRVIVIHLDNIPSIVFEIR